MLLAGSLAGLLACGEAPEATTPGLRRLVRGLDAPESVVHDAARDRYLVSVVGGRPEARDSNGLVVAVDPESGAVTPFAEGLDAPKGLALRGELLLLSDITQLVVLRLSDGAQLTAQELPGALFLNDVAIHADGRIAVSDTQLGRIYVLQIRATEEAVFLELVATHPAPSPNGLAYERARGSRGSSELALASWAAGPLLRLGVDGELAPLPLPVPDTEALRAEGKDGLLQHGEGWLFSNWLSGEVHWVSSPPSPQPLIHGLDAPADLGVDAQRGLLLIPSMGSGALYTLPLPGSERGGAKAVGGGVD